MPVTLSDSGLYVASALDALANSPVVKAVTLSKSPFGYWRLNDPTGTTAADSSGNGHDLALLGSGTTFRNPSLLPGDPSSASCSFNGSGWFKGTNLPVLNGSNGFSLVGWFVSTVAGVNHELCTVNTMLADGVARTAQMILTVNNFFQFNCTAFAAGANASHNPNDGVVHHWVATWTVATSTLAMWIDNVNVLSSVQAHTLVGNGVMNIGVAAQPGGTNLLTGQIADVSMYSYPLSATDVNDLYLAGANALAATITTSEALL